MTPDSTAPRGYRGNGGKGVPPPPPRGHHHPYTRDGVAPAPTYSRSHNPSSAVVWDHDLFETGSNLYKPTLNPAVYTSLPTSNSLTPFGVNFTPPVAARLMRPTASEVSAGAVEGRLGGNNTISVEIRGAQEEEQARLAAQSAIEDRRRLEAERIQRERAQEEGRLKAMEVARARQIQLERQSKLSEVENAGHVVEVQGLVEGTSAEDVKTAFNQYGEIVYCGMNDIGQAALVARIVFVNRVQAEDACANLHGAIADGQALSVCMVPPTPNPFLGASSTTLPSFLAPTAIPFQPQSQHVAGSAIAQPARKPQSIPKPQATPHPIPQSQRIPSQPKATNSAPSSSLSLMDRMNPSTRGATGKQPISKARQPTLLQRFEIPHHTEPIFTPPRQVAPLGNASTKRTMYADTVQLLDPRFLSDEDITMGDATQPTPPARIQKAAVRSAPQSLSARMGFAGSAVDVSANEKVGRGGNRRKSGANTAPSTTSLFSRIV